MHIIKAYRAILRHKVTEDLFILEQFEAKNASDAKMWLKRIYKLYVLEQLTLT